MYFEYKNELRDVFINLDKVDKITLGKMENKINFTVNGNSVIIFCKDKDEANDLYKTVTDALIKEKGVVTRQ